jgi:hypothetical protein
MRQDSGADPSPPSGVSVCRSASEDGVTSYGGSNSPPTPTTKAPGVALERRMAAIEAHVFGSDSERVACAAMRADDAASKLRVIAFDLRARIVALEDAARVSEVSDTEAQMEQEAHDAAHANFEARMRRAESFCGDTRAWLAEITRVVQRADKRVDEVKADGAIVEARLTKAESRLAHLEEVTNTLVGVVRRGSELDATILQMFRGGIVALMFAGLMAVMVDVDYTRAHTSSFIESYL